MKYITVRIQYVITLWCITTALVIFITWSTFVSYHEPTVKRNDEEINELDSITKLKYVLIWPSISTDSLPDFETGLESFKRRQCPYTNCYITKQISFMSEKDFDAIVIKFPYKDDLPKTRSPHQKYIFTSSEAPQTYRICDKTFNNYFNWTWTFKLNSDIKYRYFTIRNKKGSIIGPKEVMHWKKIESMAPIHNMLKKKLRTKKHAAAMFAPYCYISDGREKVIADIKKELKKYNHTLDIYGECGLQLCVETSISKCLKMLETDYYFYFSYENFLSEDYVTEQLLYPLQHFTVPIVFGGVNYSRFMPDGIYLDASTYTVPRLVQDMVKIMNDTERYYSYFKWHNHYSYHYPDDSPDLDSYCELCELLNSENIDKPTVYNDFLSWWNGRNICIPMHSIPFLLE